MNSFSRSVALTALAVVTPSAFAQLKATQVASGLNQPTGYYADPTSGQGYVTQKTGQVIRVGGGTAIDFSSLTGTAGEQGLLGMAFDPNYAANNRIYFAYVDKMASNNSQPLKVVRTDGFNLSTAQTVFSVPHPSSETNHYGGTIRFGGDENLYVGMGDGGGSNDPENDAQNVNSYLGKILRLDVSGSGAGVAAAGNPFIGTNGLDEVWSYGLRNPYKFSFDALNGDLYIGDVGQNTREEVNRIGAAQGGVNFGWRTREGTVGNPATDGSVPPGAVDPIFDYDRTQGQSITGGVVYRGSKLGSSYTGRYFFGDFVAKKFWSIDPNAADIRGSLLDHSNLFAIAPSVVSIDSGFGGELFVTDFNGRVYAVEAVPEPASLAVLALGMGALIRRRKQSRAQ